MERLMTGEADERIGTTIIKHLLTVLSATSSTKYLLIPLRKYFKI